MHQTASCQPQKNARHRAKRAAVGSSAASSSGVQKKDWTVDDVKDALASRGLFAGMDQESLGDDDLILLRFVVYRNTSNKKCCTAWLSTKELLRTLSLLHDKDHVKIGTDATGMEEWRA